MISIVHDTPFCPESAANIGAPQDARREFAVTILLKELQLA